MSENNQPLNNKAELQRIRNEAEQQRMRNVLDIFGREIVKIASLSCPKEVKQLYETRLLEKRDQWLKRFQKDNIY